MSFVAAYWVIGSHCSIARLQASLAARCLVSFPARPLLLCLGFPPLSGICCSIDVPTVAVTLIDPSRAYPSSDSYELPGNIFNTCTHTITLFSLTKCCSVSISFLFSTVQPHGLVHIIKLIV